MTYSYAASRFRSALSDGRFQAGPFVKTASSEIIEIMSLSGVDVICLDAEHAALGRSELDWALALARALDLPALVRVAYGAPDTILQALDGGAAGILVPHVRTIEGAVQIARWARFSRGGRGYAGSTRFGGFTTRSMPDVLRAGREQVSVIAQIEDPEALEVVEEIAAVPGVDGLFFGAADMAVGMGLTSSKGAEVEAAFKTVAAAARAAGCALGAYVAGYEGFKAARSEGVTLALVGSDQGMVLAGARALAFETKKERDSGK